MHSLHRCRGWLLVIVSLLLLPCWGRQQPSLKAPLELFAGLGSLHHPITTSNPQAQRYFDQGLTLTYAFNFTEAAKSFQQATQLDPHAAMAYWGLALASGPNYNSPIIDPSRSEAGYQASRRAASLVQYASAPERAYIAAMLLRFPAAAPATNFQFVERTYANAMASLARAYLDDPDAATLYAESLMDLHSRAMFTPEGHPSPDTFEVIRVLEEVLRRWPDHIGANHFYIHTMENSPWPERALPSARRLETLSPAAGHLLHMPAHIYMRVGDYSAAVASNVAAISADEAYLRIAGNANPNYMAGYGEHNRMFLMSAAEMEGDYTAAQKSAQRLVDDGKSPQLAQWRLVDGYTTFSLTLLIRFARWAEILSLAPPPADAPATNYFWHYTRGCAYAAQGHPDLAQQERAALSQSFASLPPGHALGFLPNTWDTVNAIADTSLEARIAGARGDWPTSIRLWRSAISTEDNMVYHEPPDWFYPMRESLGAALLRNHQPKEAESVFRNEVARDPRSPRALFGLMKSLQAESLDAEAAEVGRELVATVWKGGTLRIEDF